MDSGDIVWVRFPYDGKSAETSHPALVLDVESEGVVVAAYGSSKHVDANNPLNNEVIISNPEDLKACGLKVPTRFDIGVRARLTVRENAKIGALPKRKIDQLYRAAVFCGLLGS